MQNLLPVLLTGLLLQTITHAAPAKLPATPLTPSQCVLPGAKGAAATAEYDGKTYYFRDAACKDEFLTDPERYSQLYDALLELQAEGKKLPPPKAREEASLVPS